MKTVTNLATNERNSRNSFISSFFYIIFIILLDITKWTKTNNLLCFHLVAAKCCIHLHKTSFHLPYRENRNSIQEMNSPAKINVQLLICAGEYMIQSHLTVMKGRAFLPFRKYICWIDAMLKLYFRFLVSTILISCFYHL